MTNPFYEHSDGVPANQTRGVSSLMRNEFDLIQAGFDALRSYTWTFNNVTLTGSPVTTTPPDGDNSFRIPTTEWVNRVAFASGLPAQSVAIINHNIRSNGTTSNWGFDTTTHVSLTTATAVAGSLLSLENAASTAVTANPSPVDEEEFEVFLANKRIDNTIDFGTKLFVGPYASYNILVLDLGVPSLRFKFSTSLNYWRLA